LAGRVTITFYPSIGTGVYISKIIWQRPVAYIATKTTYDLSAGIKGTGSLLDSINNHEMLSELHGAGYSIVNTPAQVSEKFWKVNPSIDCLLD
jgi:hypothetical protein